MSSPDTEWNKYLLGLKLRAFTRYTEGNKYRLGMKLRSFTRYKAQQIPTQNETSSLHQIQNETNTYSEWNFVSSPDTEQSKYLLEIKILCLHQIQNETITYSEWIFVPSPDTEQNNRYLLIMKICAFEEYAKETKLCIFIEHRKHNCAYSQNRRCCP